MMKRFVLAAGMVLAAVNVYAAGPHEDLSCTGCHNIHYAKGPIIFAVKPNRVLKNARTNKNFTGVTSLCLGCHAEEKNGGQGILPISTHTSHPFGIAPNPKVARVPKGLLRGGALSCVSCHDPHPSNSNYKYLRVDTAGGDNMQVFCAVCHPAKADSSTTAKAGRARIFSSMDERRVAVKAPAVRKKK
jgi:predicted CXXCH cytochrome family protein